MQATGMTAMKLGAAVYLVPFVIAYSPSLLLIGEPAELGAMAGPICTERRPD